MADKHLEESFDTLKQTIPLLLKHKISAIPTNYSLWYTYVSNESPELKAAVDNVIDSNIPLSELKTQELYRNYLSEQEEVTAWQLRQSLEAMLLELSQSVKDTKTETSSFKDTMDGCIDDLAKVEKEGMSVTEVMGLVRNMVNEVQAMRKSTIGFSGALANAEKEIEKLKTQLQESQQEALYDALTGLCNRRYFDSELESKMGMEKLSLMLVDLDHFKKVNDEHGHLMGDLVLKAAAKKLQAACRDNAQVFRYGGEEFVVLMPNADLTKARHTGDVLRRAVEKIAVKDRRTGDILGDITTSVGVAQLEKGESASDLLERADKMLYQAKNLGRNRVMPMA